MNNDLRPADTFHPSIYILEEIQERGWSLGDLATRMADTPTGRTAILLTLELYLESGPSEPTLFLGQPLSEALGRAFGVSSELFLELHRSWLYGAKLV